MIGPVPLRSLPGIDAIEAAMVLNYADREEDHGLGARVSRVLSATFGIDSGDMGPRYPSWALTVDPDDWTAAQRQEVERLCNDWNGLFDVLDVPEAEAVEAWRGLGWDVLDGQGIPMRCVDLFGMAMVCCAKGARGRSMEELAATVWASPFAGERRPSEADKARNERFLKLGDRRYHRRGERR